MASVSDNCILCKEPVRERQQGIQCDDCLKWNRPFTQLLTLNAFVKNDDHVKQVPLVFAIMSGKKKRDYKAVLEAVLSILPDQPRVKRVTLDFEKAMWSAMRQVLPDVELKGCSFHWTQALWRKVSTSD